MLHLLILAVVLPVAWPLMLDVGTSVVQRVVAET